MRLKTFELQNYKGFLNSGQIDLGPGFNIIVGQNNAGKSALLEGISLQFQDKPFRGSLYPEEIDTLRGTEDRSFANFSLNVELPEFDQAFVGIRQGLPLPPRNSGLYAELGNPNSEPGARALLEWVRQRCPLEVALKFSPKGPELLPSKLPSHGLHDLGSDPNNPTRTTMAVFENQRAGFQYFGGTSGESREEFGTRIGNTFREQIYFFHAERAGLGECPTGTSGVLKQNASNLPEALNTMQGDDPVRFADYSRAVLRVLPNLFGFGVSLAEIGGRISRIHVWIKSPESRDPEYGRVPLSECGTGIGQVLAILYIAFKYERSPRVILIDEPSSFLHPGAIRQLFSVLAEFSDHQYIISTHSPNVLSSARAKSLIHVTQEGGRSFARTTDLTEREGVRSFLEEVGATIGDVLGVEKAIWVEGTTEEIGLPDLIQAFFGLSSADVGVFAVKSTADFQLKGASHYYEVYKKAVAGTHLLPADVVFLFDRELKTDEDVKREEEKAAGQVKYLRRRMFENYLLDSRAIAAVLGSETSLTQCSDRDTIENMLQSNVKDQDPNVWLQTVDGARLLTWLFETLSESTVSFRKTVHSPALAMWLLRNDPAPLFELRDTLSECLQALCVALPPNRT